MKILFLTKRYYMAKDLPRDRYGRFYKIPKYLNSIGNNVIVSCLSYRKQTEPDSINIDNFEWLSIRLRLNPFAGIRNYYIKLCRLIENIQPNVIAGVSGCFNVIIAAELAAKYSVPCGLDLYDNFESYRATSISGIKYLFSKAVGKADGVSVVSQKLRDYVCEAYKPSGELLIVENAVLSDYFL